MITTNKKNKMKYFTYYLQHLPQGLVNTFVFKRKINEKFRLEFKSSSILHEFCEFEKKKLAKKYT